MISAGYVCPDCGKVAGLQEHRHFDLNTAALVCHPCGRMANVGGEAWFSMRKPLDYVSMDAEARRINDEG